ncbi:MAG TPA: hypothetical protein VLT16_16120, partial [Candidatus Limnocylindrales bacterium]|nr:hypothetical protein [Candidatus Limnocylindrales bacterium]
MPEVIPGTIPATIAAFAGISAMPVRPFCYQLINSKPTPGAVGWTLGSFLQSFQTSKPSKPFKVFKEPRSAARAECSALSAEYFVLSQNLLTLPRLPYAKQLRKRTLSQLTRGLCSHAAGICAAMQKKKTKKPGSIERP